MNSIKDKEIIAGIINHDQKTLNDFYQNNSQIIFRFINRQIKDPQLSEELTQDVFIDFFESLRDFHFQSSLKTFLFSITKHKIIDSIRKKKIKKILFSALPSYVVEGLKTVLIDDEIEKQELQNKIAKVFSHLPNDYQLVLRLKYQEGEKVQSIAQKLALKFKATESLIFRARKAFINVFKTI
ncbi:hypothetical protein COW96_02630 [Candidatus Roizmanbacteria bacterium CG22_combo_CG10-13_8_21_14_all_33_16]|uniref:RNA polymerase sigma-70 region 2 domain-containing protein n=1 Tax=Candidatus Roizmanbacteria bacterium CG22_combo_CG10-13_8_21_14_all_33_16 TaxID=1974859 RepID=A0A2H0C3C2_9BACT|nr:MAG: hypothetical protein COW96_02630 [Candidatus Roizmanbacteria bacterium CG22_combo_CG10-13_8_21_14_all_33_16]